MIPLVPVILLICRKKDSIFTLPITQSGSAAFRFVRGLYSRSFLFFDGHSHRPFGNMVMSNTEIFSKLLYKLRVVFFPEVHQFCAFKKLPMVNEPLFVFFSILFLFVIICWSGNACDPQS